MKGEARRLRILNRLVGGPEGFETKRLCDVCAEVTGATGAGIMLIDTGQPRGSLCTTNDVSALIEVLQYDLGEGPCVDAYNFAHPIMEPDLAQPDIPRWTAFAPPAVAAGVRAVFGFPLQLGAARLGALNLYRDRPGPMGDEQRADAMVMADVAARSVLLLQASAPPGVIAAELETNADFHYIVHQAAGMVAAQLDASVGHALVRLRAHAFGNDRSLSSVAHEVVSRTLRFEPPASTDDST